MTQSSFAALVFVVCAILVACVDSGTAYGMYEKWLGSAGYAHGFLVVPFVFYLIWLQRGELVAVTIRPSASGLAALLPAGLLWALGDLATVDTVRQFGLVSMVIAVVWAALGDAYFRRIGFPLACLYLTIPFGGGLVPYLRDWTADATVFALRASGVAVYQEGTDFVIPSGTWSVAEACAGSRYFISATVIGVFYAALTYRDWPKRLLFVAVNMATGVGANWLRAYTIVMVAHLSGNEWGLGVSHLALGWIIFALAMAATFWVGGWWADPPPETPGKWVEEKVMSRQAAGGLLAAAMMALAWKGLVLWREIPADSARPLDLPKFAAAPGWKEIASDDHGAEWNYPGARMTLHQTFASAAGEVSTLVAYYHQPAAGQELIHYAHGLVDEGMHRSENLLLPAGGEGPPMAFSGALFKRKTDHLFDVRCYWVGGRWTDSEGYAKAWLALTRLLTGGNDAAVLEVHTTAAARNEAALQAARTVLAAFLRDFGAEFSAAFAAAYTMAGKP